MTFKYIFLNFIVNLIFIHLSIQTSFYGLAMFEIKKFSKYNFLLEFQLYQSKRNIEFEISIVYQKALMREHFTPAF